MIPLSPPFFSFLNTFKSRLGDYPFNWPSKAEDLRDLPLHVRVAAGAASQPAVELTRPLL